MSPKPTEQLAWGSAVSPLSPDEAAEAALVGSRLVGEFQALIAALPSHAQSGVGLARYLDLDRGTSTRLVSAFARTLDGLEVLRQLPGVRGLRLVVEKLNEKGGEKGAEKGTRKFSKGALARASAAVDQLERLILASGGSQTKLLARLTATRALHLEKNPEAFEQVLIERRRQLYEASSNALGQRGELAINCSAFQPSAGSTTMMDHALLRGLLGYRARRDSPPYAFRNFGRNDGPGATSESEIGRRDYQGLGEASREETAIDGMPGATLFREFSSDPVPLITSRGRSSETTVVIDAERADSSEGVDVVIGQAVYANWRLPALDTPPTHDVSTYIATPAARLIFDVFLHRSMAQQCVPSFSLYRTTPGIFNNPASHWYDQLPYPPAMRLLTDAQALRSSLHPRQHELIAAFFGRLGWDQRQFIGYRVEVEYPVWNGFYSFLFDYSQTNSA